MATKKFTLYGKTFYPKLFEENADKKFNPGGTYVLTLNVDDELADLWEKEKTLNKVKFDRHTKETTITIRRQHVHKNDWAGGPPVVKNADGSIRSFSDGPIWNGSEAEADVVLYDTISGKAARLEEVRILKLAEAPPMEDREDGPAPVEEKKAKGTILDDDVPF